MKRLFFILTVAAIVVVLALIVLHPKSPFFGPRDARVAIRPTTSTSEVSASPRSRVSSQQSASVDVDDVSRKSLDVPRYERRIERQMATAEEPDRRLHLLLNELEHQRAELQERDEQLAALRKQLVAVEVSRREAELGNLQSAAAPIDDTRRREAVAAAKEHAQQGAKASQSVAPSKTSDYGDLGYLKNTPSGARPPARKKTDYGDIGNFKNTPLKARRKPALGDPIVIRAGDVVVRASEFEAALRLLPAESQRSASGDARRQFATQYLQMKILAAEGIDKGLDNDPDVTSQVARLRENVIAEVMLKKLELGIDVSDPELRAAYDQNRAKYEQVRVRHILVAFKESPALRTGKADLVDVQARLRADELRQAILSGADFGIIAKSESDDPTSGARGGELGLIRRGEMSPEVEQAIFNTSVGGLTPIIKTQYGYEIFRVDQRTATPFDDAKAAVARDVRKQKLEQVITSLSTEKPLFNDAYFSAQHNAVTTKVP